MAFFEELGNKVSQAGNKIAEAARNSSQTTQLENDIRNMQAEIDGCLHQMGAMLYYEKKDPEAPKPDYDPIIARIDQLTPVNRAMVAIVRAVASQEQLRAQGGEHRIQKL